MKKIPDALTFHYTCLPLLNVDDGLWGDAKLTLFSAIHVSSLENVVVGAAAESSLSLIVVVKNAYDGSQADVKEGSF